MALPYMWQLVRQICIRTAYPKISLAHPFSKTLFL
jgi:hypothetical protein